jgi:hypothetical protein
MRIVSLEKMSLWTCFLKASVEDMFPTAHIDTCTTEFYFYEFFLPVPIFTSREISEKIPTERLFLRKMVVLQETYLALGCWLACCFCFISPS